jgi:hypothetical protein
VVKDTLRTGIMNWSCLKVVISFANLFICIFIIFQEVALNKRAMIALMRSTDIKVIETLSKKFV